MKSKSNHGKILSLTQFSILLAIEIIVCFTPLGTLPSLGVLSATLSHIPVIITAVTLGLKSGALMGFAFGACSFIYWTFAAPGAFSFIYTPFYSLGEFKGNFGSLLICFVPRILIGIATALIVKAFEKKKKFSALGYTLAGVIGSLTNTILVLGGIYFFFGSEYATLSGFDGNKALLIALGSIILTNGIPEAVIGGIFSGAVALPVKKAISKKIK